MDRKAKGEAITTDMFGKPLGDERPAFKEFVGITSDYLFGEIWSRPGRSPPEWPA